MAEEPEDELVSVKEIARRLRVDPTTVRRWIKSGKLQAITLPYRPGGHKSYRVRNSVLRNILEPEYQEQKPEEAEQERNA